LLIFLGSSLLLIILPVRGHPEPTLEESQEYEVQSTEQEM
jgi:hypothetical protein